MVVTGRSRLILEKMLMEPEKCTLVFLARELDVSERSIRRDLSDIESILKDYNLRLVVTDNVYRVRGHETDVQTLRWQLFDLSYNDYTPQERRDYIIKKLLLEKGYIKMTHIADELGVTEATVRADLFQIEDDLQSMVKIEKRRGFGIALTADEINKRRIMRNMVTHSVGKDLMDKYLHLLGDDDSANRMIQEKLGGLVDVDILRQTQKVFRHWRDAISYDIADDAFSNLLLHAAISIGRLAQGEYVAFDSALDVKAKDLETATQLIGKTLAIALDDVPQGEAQFIANHLLGIKFNDVKPMLNEDIFRAQILSNRLVSEVEKHLEYDFKDISLLSGLTVHLKSALHRLEHGLAIKNPLIESIKRDYGELFLIVRAAFGKVYTEHPANDEEIGYLVLHFASAFVKSESLKEYRALIICSSGIGTSKMLKTKIGQVIPQIKKFVNSSVHEALQRDDYALYDVIISTIELGTVDFEYFLVSPMISERDIMKIEQYLHSKGLHRDHAAKQTISTRETILKFEKMQTYLSIIVELLKDFDVFYLDVYQTQLEDIFRAMLMMALTSYDAVDVELIIKKLSDQDTFGGFGIPNTRLALFHHRLDVLEKPILKIFKLASSIKIMGLDDQIQEVSSLVLLLAPEQMRETQMEVLSYISAILIENNRSIAIFESGSSEEIGRHLSKKLHEFLN